MKKIVECVPNFSEGRDAVVIDAIAESIRATPGCTLLDVDPGKSTNRTVYTFVGTPEAVVEGALSAARVAMERIDMTRQTGEHPRMGAMDVCPFVPVANVTMDECVACAKEFGRRAGAELGIPIYLYEEASTTPIPEKSQADPGRRVRGAQRSHRDAGVEARFRSRRVRSPLGCNRDGCAVFPGGLQRQRPRNEGTGASHRAQHSRAGTRRRRARAPEGGQGDRLVGRRIQHGAGVDESRRLQDHTPACRV